MELLLGLIILIFSAILHEVAHGIVADRLGDPTARLMGRLTLNPIPHIDPIMSIAFPLLLILSGSPVIFGGAKPVPIDPYNLREGRKDVALVALAGPLTNVLLAISSSLLLHGLIFWVPHLPHDVYLTVIINLLYLILYTATSYNILLAIFNLLPIPPLDGSKIFSLLLPEREAAWYLSLSNIGMFILFFLLFFPIGGFSLSAAIAHWYGIAKHLMGI
jgi:Zn-dependent protease